MTSYIALFRGNSIEDAQIIAVSADPDVVSRFASELLEDPNYSEAKNPDPILKPILEGKRQALRMIEDRK